MFGLYNQNITKQLFPSLELSKTLPTFLLFPHLIPEHITKTQVDELNSAWWVGNFAGFLSVKNSLTKYYSS